MHASTHGEYDISASMANYDNYNSAEAMEQTPIKQAVRINVARTITMMTKRSVRIVLWS